MGVSRRAFARLIGVTEGAVRKAILTGRIKTLPDGTLDAAAALKAWKSNTDPGRIRITGTVVPGE
jgi:hypothetical protein